MRLIVRRCKVSSWLLLLLLLLLLLPALLLQSKLPGGSWINSSSSTCCRSSSATGYGQDPAGWLATCCCFPPNDWLSGFLHSLDAVKWMAEEVGRKAAEGRRRSQCWRRGLVRFVILWNDLQWNLYCVNYHQISFGIVSWLLLMVVLLLLNDSVEQQQQHHPRE